ACGSSKPSQTMAGAGGASEPNGAGGAGGSGGACLPAGTATSWFIACPTTVKMGKTVVLSWSKPPAVSLAIDASPGGRLLENSTMWKGTLTSPPIEVDTRFDLSEVFG